MTDTRPITNTTFRLVVFETIKYINSKNITPREKLAQMEEFGLRIGERIVNFLMNKIGGKSKMETEEIIKFISNKVWQYVFPKPVNKVQTNKKGFYFYEVDDIYLFYPLVRDKEPTTEDMVIADYILTFLSGMIKGSLSVFNIESIVNGVCKFDILYTELLFGFEKGKNEGSTIFPFQFNIMILSN